MNPSPLSCFLPGTWSQPLENRIVFPIHWDNGVERGYWLPVIVTILISDP